MSIGKLARKVLGKRLVPIAAHFYRGIFVDLDKVADCLCDWIPDQARVLDIGGGDGALVNRIMARRAHVSFTLIDISTTLGAALLDQYRNRVEILPGVSVRKYLDDYLDASSPPPLCVLISDVIHHIPAEMRTSFLSDLHRLFIRTGAVMLFKDFEPGHFISWLGYVSDRYVSGDKHVSFLSRAELRELITNSFGGVKIADTRLFSIDKPNYLMAVLPSHDPRLNSELKQ